ncbi:MAG: hypothetical protein HW402_1118 [Dehalococcoidales bacterium]|nr:hypothetical protein [Dehalococcoidales bacterium]
MKKIDRSLGRETGQVLVAVMLFMLVGAVVISASLTLTATTMMFGRATKEYVNRFYSGDAGVERGLWDIKAFDPGMLGHLPDSSESFTLNGLQVVVLRTWESVNATAEKYTINSTATENTTGRNISVIKYYFKITS